MTPPPLTPRQRAAAVAKAVRTRKKRSEVKKQLRHSHASLTNVFEEGQADAAIGNMRVLDLAASLPRMNKAEAKKIMEGLGIADTRRLHSLSLTEQTDLRHAFAKHDLPGQTRPLPQQPVISAHTASSAAESPASHGQLRRSPDAGDHSERDDGPEAVRLPERVGEGAATRSDPAAQATGTSHVPGDQAVHAVDATSPPAGDDRPWWRKWGVKLGTAVAAVIIGALGSLLGVWFAFFAGPSTPAPSTSPIGNPGHPPGRQDVSTISPHHRFYAVANFFYFQGCGRPCWLPLYQKPTENSTGVTRGWPCEYYEPDAKNGPFCLRPSTRRRPNEMADPANKHSGDRILVICQTTHIANGQAAQTIRNEAGQSSGIWDMVAVPRPHIFYNGVIAGRLRQVPGMTGFYEAYGSDIWLGNTGWHSISCK